MAQAHLTKDIKEHTDRQEKVRGIRAQRKTANAFKSKKFADLTDDEKDELLKTIGVSLGLIQPD